MRRVIIALAVLAGTVVLPSRIHAQSSDATLLVGGLGGVTFGTVSSAGAAGRVGFKLAPNVFLIGEAGRMGNVMPKELEEFAQFLEDDLEFELGAPVTLEFSVPANYGFVGVRFVQPRQSLNLFAEAGIGAGQISVNLSKAEVLGIDVTDDVNDLIDDEVPSETKVLFALGGGLNVPMGQRTSIDVGYRYTRIATEDPAINSSMVYAAFVFGR